MAVRAPRQIAGEHRAAASAVEVPLADGKPANRLQLLAIGNNPGRDGKVTYTVADRAHAERIVAASAAYHRSTVPVVDYDHQSVFGAKDGVGGRAPAAGWMPRLVANDDGIWAEGVEWTPAASQALASREYRYISPYFGHDAQGRVTRIFNAALTNRPELELRAVASQSDTLEQETRMSAITDALGLADDADENAIVSAIAALKTDHTAVCSALGLKPSATAAEIRTAASARAPDATAFVPRTEFDRLRTRLDSIDEERVTASVDDAIRGGKVAPASRDWAVEYARKDPAGFASYIGSAPAIVSETAEQRRAAAVKDGTMTDDERAVAASMGIADDAWIKSRKENTL